MGHQGELAALTTAFCWTITALAFEAAARRIGSLSVNILRMFGALVFLTIYSAIARGRLFPFDASGHTWFWLSLSGLVGFTLGDLALFRGYLLIGARRTLLIAAFVPVFTALGGWLLLDEKLNARDACGMALTIFGVAVVILERRADAAAVPRRTLWLGALLGLCAALGQAVGLAFSKMGIGDFDPFAATQIRAFAGTVGFVVIFTAIGWWPKVREAAKDAPAMRRLTLGAFFGPFLGVGFSLMAVQHAKAGVAATIMSLTPVFIIAPSALVFKEKITARAVGGALLAVGGSALLFF
jgi:drug/metabolite transporter (DMT)-like permease